MKRQGRFLLLVLAVLTMDLVLLTAVAQAQGPKGSQPRSVTGTLGNGFSYQGQLKQGSSPVNGTCSLSFGLWDAATLGAQVGVTLTQSVAVTGGLFTSQPLDFGSTAFDGNARYLAISAKCGSDPAHTPLSPRQQLTAAPYALFAKRFGGYQNVKVVAKSGGDYTSVAAAVNSIGDASATNPYLVYVAPGVYSETVTMKQYVDIEGAGELATKITYSGSASGNTGTVIGADNAELRFLTVENTGGNTIAIAIYNPSGSPRLTHVSATASGGSYNSIGVYNQSSSPRMTNVSARAFGTFRSTAVNNDQSWAVMTNVTATASGPSQNYAVNNVNGSPTLLNVTASASGGSFNVGVDNYGASPTMTDVSATASGGGSNYGLYNETGSSPTMAHVTLTASGGTQNYGAYSEWASATILNSTIRASGGTSYGIYTNADSGTHTVTVNNSQITGANNTIYNSSHFVVRIGASQLSGGAVSNAAGGTVTCIGAWDENYASPGYTTCP